MISATIEFVEQKTDYQAVFFSLKGLDGYFALKMPNDEKVPLGKKLILYLPLARVSIYDQNHNKANAREVVHLNSGSVTVSHKNGKMVVKTASGNLVYPENPKYPDGKYQIIFKQDKLVPLFPKKMLKKGYQNPEADDLSNRINASAYDEEVLGDTILAYVQIPGFENYVSLVLKNNFSVYKLPKFQLYVPEDAFTLIPE